MRALLTVLMLIGCAVEEPAVNPACDPGHEAWVREAMPLVWGRHPRSAHEVTMLAERADALGREAVVRAMAQGPEFRAAWQDRLYDILRVNRVGFRGNPSCFRNTALEPGTALAEHVRDFGPAEAPFAEAWTFADLIDSALRLDDLSVLHRALLFSMLAQDKLPVGEPEAQAMTLDYLQLFERVWLGRDLDCLPCHSAEYSVTGSDDPAEDRTWEIPGYVEEAVFGASAGRPKADIAVFFRRLGVVDGVGFVWGSPDWIPQGGGLAPWGTDESCGAFLPPDLLIEDRLGGEGWFVDEAGPSASAWDLEGHLHEGVEVLRQDGFVVDSDLRTGGPEAFAWLVAMNTAEAVWQDAFGRPLTVAHHFPRNRGQRDQLDAMRRAFVDSGWSLVELVVAVATSPTFAVAAPSTCGTVDEPFTLAAVLDPWTVDRSEGARANHLGDRIERRDARTLVRSLSGAMGWSEPPPFMSVATDPTAVELNSLGFFLKDSAPGFRGSDFQGTLAWEDLFGACEPPSWGGASGGDWIDGLLDSAPDADPWALAAALKDRLLADPVIDDEERSLLQAIAEPGADVEASLRSYCGLWAMSPAFQLSGLPRPGAVSAPAVVAPSSSEAEVCAALAAAAPSLSLACP